MKFFALFLLFIFPLQTLAQTPDDDYFSEQWYLPKIQAEEAWELNHGGEVVVAVIDTGVDLSHPDLVDQIWVNDDEIEDDEIDNDQNGFVDDVHGWDFVNNDNSPEPGTEHGFNELAAIHGTLVAGVIGATTDNDEGIAGIGWNVKIMPVRILDSMGSGQTSAAAKAINYAVKNGADVINLSFTGVNFDQDLEDALRRAYRAGVFVTAALGNDDESVDSEDVFPVCIGSELEDWVFGVAASDEGDHKADFSNYGKGCTDLSAPGIDIFGTLFYWPNASSLDEPYGGYYDGTSVATPMVAGAAALLKAAFPDITVEEMQLALKLSADPMLTKGTYYQGEMGTGRLNVYKAIEMASSILGIEPVLYSQQPSVSNQSNSGSIVLASGFGSATRISVWNGSEMQASWLGFGEKFLGGASGVSVADLDNDGVEDIVVGAGIGGGPQVRVFALDGTLKSQFFAFDSSLRGGVRVATAASGIATLDPSGISSTLRIYSLTGDLQSEFTPTVSLKDARIEFDDLDNDGISEVVLASGRGLEPRIAVYEIDGTLVSEFLAFEDQNMTAGLYVATGDVDLDGQDDIIVGTDVGAGPQVRIWSVDGTLKSQFFAFDSSRRLGARIAVGDVNNDGKDEILAIEGPGGSNSVYAFDQIGTMIKVWENVGSTTLGGDWVGIW